MYYVVVETPVEVYEGEIQRTRRGWLEASSLDQAIALRDTYSKLGTAIITSDVSEADFDLNEVEGIPV